VDWLHVHRQANIWCERSEERACARRKITPLRALRAKMKLISARQFLQCVHFEDGSFGTHCSWLPAAMPAVECPVARLYVLSYRMFLQ